MPKIVDQDARRTEIVGALRRVIQREGIAGASVRTVATEAGLSAGAMRHYFASQSELLGFALAAMTADVERRIVARVEAWRKGPPTLEGLVAVLEEVAPSTHADGSSSRSGWSSSCWPGPHPSCGPWCSRHTAA